MIKSLIAGIAAFSLATATPVAAQDLDRENLGKLLLGLAAVAVIGAGLAGLSCAKYLVDAGFTPHVYEARDVLGTDGCSLGAVGRGSLT